MNAIKNTLVRFSNEEDGLALTEYLVLLGLLTGLLIGAIILFGNTLNTEWRAWSAWIGTNLNPPANGVVVDVPAGG